MTYKMTLRRKLVIATWSSPKEANIYGKLTLNVDKVLQYLEEVREATGAKVTITHFIGKIIGIILGKMPDINGRIVWGRYRQHKDVAISFLVQLENGKDLSKVKVVDIDKKSLVAIAQELQGGAGKLRKGEDQEFQKSKNTISLLPGWVLKPMLRCTGYLTGAIGMNASIFGLEAFPFGACVITSVGMLGLDEAYIPPTPFAHVPIYITIPQIKERPVVEDGNVVIRKQLDLTATIDHRFMDGFQGGLIANSIRDFFANPSIIESQNAGDPCVD